VMWTAREVREPFSFIKQACLTMMNYRSGGTLVSSAFSCTFCNMWHMLTVWSSSTIYSIEILGWSWKVIHYKRWYASTTWWWHACWYWYVVEEEGKSA
jgi:hypothetical protein